MKRMRTGTIKIGNVVAIAAATSSGIMTFKVISMGLASC
jgi:hypothetical protein